jgi:hypothetical protein
VVAAGLVRHYTWQLDQYGVHHHAKLDEDEVGLTMVTSILWPVLGPVALGVWVGKRKPRAVRREERIAELKRLEREMLS